MRQSLWRTSVFTSINGAFDLLNIFQEEKYDTSYISWEWSERCLEFIVSHFFPSWHPPSPVTLQAIWLAGPGRFVWNAFPPSWVVMFEFHSHRLWNLSLLCLLAKGIQTDRLLMGKQSLDDSLIIICLLWLAVVHHDIVNNFPLKTSPSTIWHSDNKNQGGTRGATLQKRVEG